MMDSVIDNETSVCAANKACMEQRSKEGKGVEEEVVGGRVWVEVERERSGKIKQEEEEKEEVEEEEKGGGQAGKHVTRFQQGLPPGLRKKKRGRA